MGNGRSDAEQQIARLLQTARRKLDLSVAFLSRIDETTRTMQVVDSELPDVHAGYSGPRDSGFCLAVVEGRLPRAMPDARLWPEAVRLHPADLPQIRGHVSVPVVLGDGVVYGTFCAFGLLTDPEVSPRDADVIKMDRSIVSGVDSDPILAKLAQSLVDFAHSFDVSVVAEGVETAAEHALLQTLGVDGGQGWFLGRPAPADTLVDEGTVLAPEAVRLPA